MPHGGVQWGQGADVVFLKAQLEGQKLGNTCAVVADGSEIRTDKLPAGG